MADPRIKYDIEANVTGQGDVGQLVQQIDALAREIDGPLKSGAQQAAAALRELAAKNQAIDNFVTLKREAEGAAQGLKQAQAAAQAAAREISASGAPTRAQAGNLEKLRDAVSAAKSELIAKTGALGGARAALGAYGISTTDLSQKQVAIRKSIADVRTEVAAQTPSWQAAATATANSSASQARSHRVIKDGVDSISSQLKVMQGVYAGVASLRGFESLAKDISQTADEYNNLAARIKLVTGEGAAFDAAFKGVQEIALRTNSELSSTAELFTRVAQAGKEMGLSQQQALALTETINQSIQLSGGSADSAKAAITQLIQGLQSGVLRGEEFNSVMEQSPRLARALADGLGTTTGKLREMAQQGQLTTDVVIRALQGQAQTLQQEFAQLPPTVGRAIQNLSSAWTVYIGEADAATGASAATASVLNALAGNLNTVVGLLLDAGQAGAAYAGLRLAQHFAGMATAAASSATQVGASTTALNANAAAATTAGTAASRFGTILSGLKTFTLLGIVTNFKDIGTAIGEGAARLAGYRDRSDEVARSLKVADDIARQNIATNAAMAQAIQLASEKSRGLTDESRRLLGEFDKMVKTGASVEEALSKVTKAANLGDLKGIEEYGRALADLGARGVITGEQLRKALGESLKGEDLVLFSTKAQAAFASVKDNGDLLAATLDAVLRESIRRAGLEFDVLAGGMGKASRSAINDTEAMIEGLDRLKAQGIDVAQALTASIGQGIKTADSQAAIEAVRQQIEFLRSKLGDKLADGLLDQAAEKAKALKAALDDATPGINSVAEAMKRLGVTSEESLQRAAQSSREAYQTMVQSGTASTRELTEGFKKYAQEAIEANNGVASYTLASEAAMRGLEIQTDRAGKSIVRAMDEGGSAARRFRDGIDHATRGFNDQRTEIERRNEALERGIDAQERANKLAERAAELERKRLGVDKEGFSTDKSGNRLVAGGDLTSRTGIVNFLKAAGVTDEAVARSIANEFADSKGEITYMNNPGQRKYGGYNSTISSALLRAAEQWTFNETNAGGGKSGESSNSKGQTVTVNLNVNGRSTAINVASQSDANALIAALQTAQRAAGG